MLFKNRNATNKTVLFLLLYTVFIRTIKYQLLWYTSRYRATGTAGSIVPQLLAAAMLLSSTYLTVECRVHHIIVTHTICDFCVLQRVICNSVLYCTTEVHV
jgi:uncharacterized membrane protein (DUF485 family)